MGRRGFTLIELSIVLTIIGLMVGGSFKAMQVMRERAKIAEAKEQVLSAKNAVVGYAIEYPSLPLANNFDANLSPLRGNEANLMMYVPANNLLTDDVCAFTITDLNITVFNVDGSSRIVENVAFAIAHASANSNMQTAYGTPTANNINVRSPSQRIDDNTTPINRQGDFYDDIVEWVTLVQLQQTVGCNDKPLRIVNSSLPDGYEDRNYSARIEIDGNYSIPTSSSCVFSNNAFSYNSATFDINASAPLSVGTVSARCDVQADDRNTSKLFAITINPSDMSLRILNNSLPSGIVGTSYSATIFIGGNFNIPTANSCTFVNPSGLSYSNFVISGTPTASGTVGVNCSVTADNKTATRAFAITINPADSNGSGGGGGGGGTGGGVGTPCSSNAECAAGLNCTGPTPKTCK